MMSYQNAHVLLLLFSLAPLARAYTTFELECSKSQQPVNYVAAPPMRGTLTILRSSLFMIAACAWTLHHLNMSEQREGRDPGKW
jgi:hypothetical protein